MEKSQIRAIKLFERNSLSSENLHEMSAKIKANLYSLPEFVQAKNVMFYVSNGSEAQTHEMIKESILRKEVCVPKLAHDRIIPAAFTGFESLKPGRYRILEPNESAEVTRQPIDLVVVPGIAFDELCNRIGSGKGYYDRFLMGLECSKIGLAFDFQIVKSIQIQTHDVAVDAIVTESRVIRRMP